MATPRLFVDASVWIAAAASPTGGSAAVLELGRRSRVHLLASKQVLLEAEHNIRRKLPSETLFHVIPALSVRQTPPPAVPMKKRSGCPGTPATVVVRPGL